MAYALVSHLLELLLDILSLIHGLWVGILVRSLLHEGTCEVGWHHLGRAVRSSLGLVEDGRPLSDSDLLLLL